MSILGSTFKDLIPNPAMRAAVVLAAAALLVALWRMDSVQREMRTDIDGIRTEQRAMRADIDGMRAEIDGMRADIEKIESQLSSVQSTLDQIKGALFGPDQIRGSAPAD